MLTFVCQPAFASVLVDAAKAGDETAVRQLISQGASVKETNALGQTALHFVSTWDEDGQLTSEIIAHGAEVDKQDLTGKTPLMLASERSNKASVDALLAHGAKPNTSDKLGNIALHYALYSRAGKVSPIVRSLLDRGSSVNWVNRKGQTAFDLAYDRQEQKLDQMYDAYENPELPTLRAGLNQGVCRPEGLSGLFSGLSEALRGATDALKSLPEISEYLQDVRPAGQKPVLDEAIAEAMKVVKQYTPAASSAPAPSQEERSPQQLMGNLRSALGEFGKAKQDLGSLMAKSRSMSAHLPDQMDAAGTIMAIVQQPLLDDEYLSTSLRAKGLEDRVANLMYFEHSRLSKAAKSLQTQAKLPEEFQMPVVPNLRLTQLRAQASNLRKNNEQSRQAGLDSEFSRNMEQSMMRGFLEEISKLETAPEVPSSEYLRLKALVREEMHELAPAGPFVQRH